MILPITWCCVHIYIHFGLQHQASAMATTATHSNVFSASPNYPPNCWPLCLNKSFSSCYGMASPTALKHIRTTSKELYWRRHSTANVRRSFSISLKRIAFGRKGIHLAPFPFSLWVATEQHPVCDELILNYI